MTTTDTTTTTEVATNTPTDREQAITTKLVTSLMYLGAGPEAIAELQNRVDQITRGDSRFTVGEIETGDNGQPVCGLTFNCDSYAPPVNGEPDPQAVEDLNAALRAINPDMCLWWDTVKFFTENPA